MCKNTSFLPLRSILAPSSCAALARKNMAPKYAAPKDDVLLIKLGDKPENVIEAPRDVVTVFSACARGLPEGKSWDVGMLLAGLSARVCQRDNVLGFLNAANMLVHGVAFEQQDSKPEHSAAGLLDLLLFADAVGSSRGLLSALDESAAAAAAAGKLTAQVSRAAGAEKETLELSLACGHYFSKSNPLLLRRYAEGSTAAAVSVLTAADEDERAAVQRQVADLLEPLLHITYRLELPALTAALHTFIRINSCTPSLTAPDSPLLDTATLAAVFSRRVVAEHAHAGDACRAALINNIISEPCALAAGPGLRQLLKPLDVPVMHNKHGLDIVYAGPPAAPAVIKFTAEVLQGFRGFRQGQKVSVELDLFGKSRVLIGAEGAGSSMAAHSVQLLLGLRG